MKKLWTWTVLGATALGASLSYAQTAPVKVDPARLTPTQPVAAPKTTQPLLKVDPKVVGTLKGKLPGYVDLHAHPMSHLGFGRKAMHGAPDVGILMPAGSRNCNAKEFRARSMEEALGNCNSTHGGWGTDNTCGDYLRAAVISHALDADFKYNVPFERNAHGDHEHAGYPEFKFWPHHTSILHQQMWWEWLKRAHDGGLNVMVALTVNSETLAAVLNGDAPYDDKSVADVQIDETIKFVGQHPDFMEIAYSSADVRRIVGAGKLAVILGMEVDKIGNFGKPGVRTDEAAVRAEIERLYRKGIRYAFPIHLIDNAFGGSAVYEHLFNFANKYQNGYFYRVETNPNIGFSAALIEGARGVENALIYHLNAALTAVGHLPAPCMNDARCMPPPGKVMCCGSYQNVVNMFKTGPELDAYNGIKKGHVNSLGLTHLGEVAIREMMKRGIIVDVDHMSEKALRKTLEIAKSIPGGYPLVMGHNGVRPATGGNERGAPADVLKTIIQNGGMLGLGTADTTPQHLGQAFGKVDALFPKKTLPLGAVALGTDVNGFEPLPKNGRPEASAAELERQSKAFYEGFFAASPIKTKSQKPRGGAWDYIIDGGVSHYGLMPEFVHDVKDKNAALHEQLMNSAEYFATMWAKIEAAAQKVSSAPVGGTYPQVLAPITNLCPNKKLGGDLEFGGHGPRVTGTVTLGISADGTNLTANVRVNAKETQSDWSEVAGEWTVNVGSPAPAGMKYTRIVSPTTSTFAQTLSGGGRNEVFEGCDGGEHVITPASGPVARIVMVGDTGGADISTDNDCTCDTRIVRIEFKTIDATLSPR